MIDSEDRQTIRRVINVEEGRTQPMDFSDALLAMTRGQSVRRAGWHKPGMRVFIENLASVCDPTAIISACCVLAVEPRLHQPGWLPSQSDLFAYDWEIAD